MARRKSHTARSYKGRKCTHIVRVAIFAALLIGIALVIYGYLSYHNLIIWMGIAAVIVGLWWAVLNSTGRSSVDARARA